MPVPRECIWPSQSNTVFMIIVILIVTLCLYVECYQLLFVVDIYVCSVVFSVGYGGWSIGSIRWCVNPFRHLDIIGGQH